MKTVSKILGAFLLVGLANAQPTITGGPVNAASYALAGLPNANIAQGSMFILFGQDLGPSAQANSVIAYNLGNLWRRLVLPNKIENWSLISLQQRLVKTGGRLVKHARYYWLLLAEGHLTRRVFAAILKRIWALPLPVG